MVDHMLPLYRERLPETPLSQHLLTNLAEEVAVSSRIAYFGPMLICIPHQHRANGSEMMMGRRGRKISQLLSVPCKTAVQNRRGPSEQIWWLRYQLQARTALTRPPTLMA